MSAAISGQVSMTFGMRDFTTAWDTVDATVTVNSDAMVTVDITAMKAERLSTFTPQVTDHDYVRDCEGDVVLTPEPVSATEGTVSSKDLVAFAKAILAMHEDQR